MDPHEDIYTEQVAISALSDMQGVRVWPLITSDMLMWVHSLQVSAARSPSSRAVAEVKVNGRARGERDGGRCGLDGWARLSATWAMPWPLE